MRKFACPAPFRRDCDGSDRPSRLRELLERHGFTFSKAMGQNFLVNPSVCPRMAELGGAAPGVGVLEIGPGVGVLTAELARRAGRVVCVELDPRLPPILAETLAEFDNVEIVLGDVMEVDLQSLIAGASAGCRWWSARICPTILPPRF